VTRKGQFSLRRLTLSSAAWYATVPLGWALVVAALYFMLTTPAIENAPAFAMTAGLLIILELLPLVQGRGHDPQGLVMSTAFVCAMLFVWGIWPAVVSVVIASVASDLRAHKSWWKVMFNPAQYALSVSAAYLVMLTARHGVSLSNPLPNLDIRDLAWMAAAWVTYFTINLFVVCAVVSYSRPFKSLITEDFRHYTSMSFAVMALSPLVVLAAQRTWALLPLLLIPLLLLFYTAAMSLEREHAAGHDALTGLPNRMTLQFELDNALVGYWRDHVPFGLMLIDMDDFKRVNDTLGHQVGDRLLVQFASRLRDAVRPEDLVARLGGDEFAVVVYDAREPEVVVIAERIHAAVSDSIEVGGLSLEVGASIGISVCPEHGSDASTLLRRADVAMYNAKEKRTRIEVYHSERDLNSADRLGLLGELRQALVDDELELHYQPKVGTSDGTPIGVEALVRWRHPVRGYVPPDEFIGLAEGSGIMPLLTARVVCLALQQTARWRDEGMTVPIAVNIAPTDLTGGELASVITEGLAEHQLPPGMLQLEITERIVTHQLDEAKRTLARMREMGVAISLDDFGTGYSSLLRLSSLQVDEIKIDRGFVSELSQGERGIGIVRALIDLAHALGMPAIAEGVETAEELAMLHTLGCDGVQGWHVARPMPEQEATAWLRERMPVPLQIVADPPPATSDRVVLRVAG
jgi:diguanylate cyclase (GGDEF)-like protein